MLISTKGRYALRVLIDLAEQNQEELVPLKEIATRQDISEKYLESILRVLVRADILKAVRGKGGGYRLAEPPEQYTVGRILRLTEESLAPVACLEQSPITCPRYENCRTVGMWQGLDRLIHEYLDSVTIAQLAKDEGGLATLDESMDNDKESR